jgi:hypothetical protein
MLADGAIFSERGRGAIKGSLAFRLDYMKTLDRPTFSNADGGFLF